MSRLVKEIRWIGLLLGISLMAMPGLVKAEGLKVIGSTLWSTPRNAIAQDNYIYVNFQMGLAILDATNPSHPVLSGQCRLEGYAIDLAVQGNYAFVTDGPGGLRIIDISSKSSPSLVATLNFPFPAYYLAVSGNYAYASYSNILTIVNITDKRNPVVVTNLTTPLSLPKITVSGNYAYLLQDNYLCIVDITDRNNPVVISNYVLPSVAYKIAIEGTNAYVADGDSGIQIINISNPLNPTKISSYKCGNALDIQLIGNYTYISNNRSLLIVDLTLPNLPQVIGNGPGMSTISVSNGFVYGVDIYGTYTGGRTRINIANVSNPIEPTLAGSYNNIPTFMLGSIYIKSTYAYVGDGEMGIWIVDIASPLNPRVINNIQMPENVYGPMDLCGEGDYLYTVNEMSGLYIFNISNPTQPTLVSHFPSTRGMMSIVVAEGFAYCANLEDLTIVNVTDPANPIFASNTCIHSNTQGVCLSGNYIYVTNGTRYVYIYEISNPYEPVEMTPYLSATGIFQTEAVGNYLIIGENIGPQIVDITNPSTASLLDSCILNSNYTGYPLISDNYFYVFKDLRIMEEVDFTDPSNIVITDSLDTWQEVWGNCAKDNLLYLCGTMEFAIISKPTNCTYVTGDINGDDVLGGNDVIYGVRYLKGIGTPPTDSCYISIDESYLYAAGDVNGNCEFRGSDITRLVAYFKSSAQLSYCPLTPPPSR